MSRTPRVIPEFDLDLDLECGESLSIGLLNGERGFRIVLSSSTGATYSSTVLTSENAIRLSEHLALLAAKAGAEVSRSKQ
jgi:hypothetical protein